jgi:RNA polymerase sigma-70 factor (ECF subfamily)
MISVGKGGGGSKGPIDPRDPERRAREDEVLLAVQRGDPGSFDRFVDMFGGRIYAFGQRMCGHREDGEDVAQETLVSAYHKLGTLREPKALRAWLYRIVANTCASRRRRSKFAPDQELSLDELLPQGGVVEDGPVLPSDSGPDGDLYRRELASALTDAVRDLPPEYRVVWMMRDVEGLSTEETAQALEISVPNVKMRLHRGRLALRRRLAHLRPGGIPS